MDRGFEPIDAHPRPSIDRVAVEIIERDDALFRRIRREHVKDGQVQRNAYYLNGEPDAQASVDLARLTTSVESAARGKLGTGAGRLFASVAIDQGLTVRHDPLGDWYPHSVIDGIATKEHCMRLAEATLIEINPTE